MHVRFIMEAPDASLMVSPETSVHVLSWLRRRRDGNFVTVVGPDGEWLGAVPTSAAVTADDRTLAEVMARHPAAPRLCPDDTLDTARAVSRDFPTWSTLPVVKGQRLVGVLRTADLPDLMPTPAAPWEIAPEVLHHELVRSMFSGFLLVDAGGVVRQINPRGAEILGVSEAEVVGRPYYTVAEQLFSHMSIYLGYSAVPRILAGQADRETVATRLQNGRQVLFNGAAIHDQGRLVGVLVTFSDVTAMAEAEQRARHEAEEAEKAFGLTLPNSKVEAKLKSSPEYQDTFDPETGLAVVTAVIRDGTYRHVVNGLRIMAELHALGLFQLVGIDKDTLVSAFIFHDLGKEQPQLAVGQTFRPQDTFEPSRQHANRSADFAAKYYHVSQDVEWLIRHHHTPWDQLPEQFPADLVPMLRIMKLVDGLSAGLTRRLATVGPFQLTGTVLTIHEHNRDARYRRCYQLAIFSGRESPVSDEPGQGPTLGDPARWADADRPVIMPRTVPDAIGPLKRP